MLDFLTAEEEYSLIKTAQGTDTRLADRAESRLIKAHEPLLRRLAREAESGGAEFEDALQVCKIAAFKAIRTFDLTRGKRLAGRIASKASQPLRDERALGSATKTPKGSRYNKKIVSYLRAISEFSKIFGHDPDESEKEKIVEGLGLEMIDVRAIEFGRSAVRIDAMAADFQHICITDDDHHDTMIQRLDMPRMREAIGRVIPSLSSRDRIVLQNMISEDPLTKKDICKETSYTSQEVDEARARITLMIQNSIGKVNDVLPSGQFMLPGFSIHIFGQDKKYR